MLLRLRIQNFALISHLELDFNQGFTVLSGETGSGKSILLGALNLILGERADMSVIRDAEKKTIVEAEFDISKNKLQDYFEQNDLDYSNDLLIRREISATGKSRAFINDTPIQLNVLKALTEKLVHIHSQHHTLELKSQDFQFDVLDYLTDAIPFRKSYQEAFEKLNKTQSLLTKLERDYQKIKQEQDYVSFQLAELEQLNLEKIAYDDLESELKLMENASLIQAVFSGVDQQISSDSGLLSQLSATKAILDKNRQLHPMFDTLIERLKSVSLELKDISYEISHAGEGIDMNPERKMELEQQLSKFNAACLKHGVHNKALLLEIYEGYLHQSQDSEKLKEEIQALSQLLLSLESELQIHGEALDKQRFAGKEKVEKRLLEILAGLKMQDSKVQFELEKSSKAHEYGLSNLRIGFSSNRGMDLKSLDKVASGGELSRLMLAIQLLLSDKKQLPTVLFDEIDTGVSGEVAQKLGMLLQQMGEKMQVLTITHLPQVAARGSKHLKVSKSSTDNSTETNVVYLTDDEKVREIARLMSGENINDAALQHAKELMS